MTDQDLHALLGRIFFPYNAVRTQRVIKSGGRFAYYTTADTAMKILRSREIWLRNANVMNDFSEISHGLACLDSAYRSARGTALNKALDSCFPGLSGEVAAAFHQLRPAIQLDTYMTCVSEHHATEDARGRLSMWRAYGGTTGVSIVFNGTAMFSSSNAIGAYSSPVFYGDPASFAEEFGNAVTNIEASIALIQPLGREAVKNAIIQMFRFAALCTKHPGFEEELEWRVIASPALYSTARLSSCVEVIDGIPQIVVKIRLENAPAHDLVGLEPAELIDRVIIGPCQFPWAMQRAFYQVLAELGVPEPWNKVVVSDIPLRHDA